MMRLFDFFKFRQIDPKLTQASRFIGYQAINKTTGSSKQKKNLGCGFYKKSEQLYYFKKSFDFPADNIAEILTASIGRKILTPSAATTLLAECVPILDNNNALFVRSTCAPTWKPLYSYKYASNFVLANFKNFYNKQTFNFLSTLSVKQKSQIAKILALCLWLGEYNCTTQNIGKDQDGNMIKIDHSCGLVNICKEKNHIVELFAPKFSYGARSNHKHIGISAHHFSDFKYLINSEYFRNALQNLIKTLSAIDNEHEVAALITQQINDILTINQNNPKYQQQDLLLDFCEHLGIELPAEITVYLQESDDTSKPKAPMQLITKLQELIVKELALALINRKKSLKLTLALLECKAQLQQAKQQNDLDLPSTCLNILQQLQQVIIKNFDNPQLNIDNIMPEWGHKIIVIALNQLEIILQTNPGMLDLDIYFNIMNFYKRIAVFSANEEYFHLLNAIENKAKTMQVFNEFVQSSPSANTVINGPEILPIPYTNKSQATKKSVNINLTSLGSKLTSKKNTKKKTYSKTAILKKRR